MEVGVEPTIEFLQLASKASAMPLGDSTIFVVLPGFEPGLLESKSSVLTATLKDNKKPS